jgi:hypothetical protein
MNYAELVDAIQGYTENTFTDSQLATFVQQAEQRVFNTVQFPSLRKNMTGTTTLNNKYLSTPSDFLAPYSLAVIDGSGNYEYLLNKDVNFIRQAYPSPTSTGAPKYYALFGPTTTSGATPQVTNELSFILGPTPDAAYTVELHFYYYPSSIVQGGIATLGVVTGGGGYSNGTYYDVLLLGGDGGGATATIVVAGGAVVSAAIASAGAGYRVDNILTVGTTIGATGSGFSVPVGTLTNNNGRSWLGDNFDSVLLYGSLVEAYTFMKGEADLIQLYDTKYKEALMLAKRLGDGMERMDAYRSGQVRVPVN